MIEHADTAIIAVAISVGSLAIALITFAVKVGKEQRAAGKEQGVLCEKTRKHEVDIGELWEHQRTQDTATTTETKVNAEKLGRMEVSLENVEKVTDTIQKDVKLILRGKA